MSARLQRKDSQERLAAVEQRIDDHEARCEERLSEIRTTAATTLKAVEGLKSRFWVSTVSLLAWALAQLWTGNEARLSGLEGARPTAGREFADVGGDVFGPAGGQGGKPLLVSGEEGADGLLVAR